MVEGAASLESVLDKGIHLHAWACLQSRDFKMLRTKGVFLGGSSFLKAGGVSFGPSAQQLLVWEQERDDCDLPGLVP